MLTTATPTLAGTALALALLLALGACSDSASKAPPPPGIPVSVATAVIRNMPVTLSAVGNVEAEASVAIKSQVDGPITEVLVRDGQDVTEGTLLFQIDARPYAIQLQQAQAALARDKALLATAAAQEQRYRELLAQKYISPDNYAQVQSARDIAAAAFSTDQGNIRQARLLLDYTQIRAPISGRLGHLQLQIGNLVKANDSAPLVVLNRVDPVVVSFSVPEQALPEIRAAMAGAQPPVLRAQMPQASADAFVTGRLDFIDNTVDAATGTLRLRGTFANPDDRLWPGQFVNVTVQLREQPQALVIPAQAVQTGPKGTYVYVVGAEASAVLREVEIARTQDHLAIVASGLKAGEQVVTDGQSRLTPGAKLSLPAAAQK